MSKEFPYLPELLEQKLRKAAQAARIPLRVLMSLLEEAYLQGKLDGGAEMKEIYTKSLSGDREYSPEGAERTKDIVFCGECKYYSRWHQFYSGHGCRAPQNLAKNKAGWKKPGVAKCRSPEYLNISNDCEWHQPKKKRQ